jgi:hypothetical protein
MSPPVTSTALRRGYPGVVSPSDATSYDVGAIRSGGLWNVPAALYAVIALAYAITLAGELGRFFSVPVLVTGLAITAYPVLWAWGIRRLQPWDPALRVRPIDLLPSLVQGGLGLGWVVPLLGLQRYHRSARLLVVGILLPFVLLVMFRLAP